MATLLSGAVHRPSGLRRVPSYRGNRVNGGLRLQKRPQVARPLRAHSGAQHSAHSTEHEDSSLRFLGFVAAGGEALSSILPSSVVSACYAVAVASVFAETAEKCHHVHKKWKNAPLHQDSVLPGLGNHGLGNHVRAARDGRKELQRGAIKMLTTVALPTLIMHGITHSGWDMFTDAAGISDALQAAAGQMAHAMHLPHADIAEMLSKAVPNIAGSFLLPLIARPAEKLVEQYMQRELRPAIDEFLSRTQSFTAAQGQSFSAAAKHSFTVASVACAAATASFTSRRNGNSTSFNSASASTSLTPGARAYAAAQTGSFMDQLSSAGSGGTSSFQTCVTTFAATPDLRQPRLSMA